MSVTTFRQPEGYAHRDVRGLAADIRANRSGCCDLEGAKAALEALEEWALWSDYDQEALELLRSAIRDFESHDFENDRE